MSNDSSELAAEAPQHKSTTKAERKLWGPFIAIVMLLVAYLVPQIVGGALLQIYPAARHMTHAQASDWLTNSIAAQFGYTLFAEGLAVLVIGLVLRHYKVGFKTLGLTKPKPSDIAFALIGFALYLLSYLLLAGVASHFIRGLNVNQQQDIGFQNPVGGLALSLTFISLVVLPPFAEETLFRGFLFTGVRRKANFLVTALVVSALFAAPHLLEADKGLLWIGGIDTFVMSLVACFLREKTGRLWGGIGVHMLKNGLAFVTLFILHSS